jgi:hypothetical protein
MAKQNTVLWIVGIAIVFVLLQNGSLNFLNQGAPAAGPSTSTCNDDSGTVSFQAFNADTGSNISTTQKVRVKTPTDSAYGPSTAVASSYAVGTQLEVLWSASNYIDAVTTVTVPCGGKVFTAQLENSTLPVAGTTWKMYTASGLSELTDTLAGTGTNASSIASGGSDSYKIRLKGLREKTTGDMIVVVEHVNTTAVDRLTLTGLGGATEVTVPSFYSVAAAGAKAYAFRVPAIKGDNFVEGYLGIEQKTGTQYMGGIYVTLYSEQAFEQYGGQSYTVGIENNQGTAKYEATSDYDFTVGG